MSPVSAPQGKESKSKSKRNKNSKDNSSKSPAADGAKKDHQGRTQVEVTGATGSSGGGSSAPGKGVEKGAKASRGVPNSKKGEGCIEWEKQERKKVKADQLQS